ncbi:MAG: hypothetical protein V4691_09180 [Pseudomonadota bacterium]
MRKLWARFSADQEGGSVVEFAFVGTFIAVCLIALIDIGGAINSFSKLSSGMRAGSQYALRYPDDNSGIAQAVASASNLPAADITVATSQFCEWNGVSGSCSAGSGSFAKYMSLTASYSMSGRYIYANAVYPAALSKNIVMRIK